MFVYYIMVIVSNMTLVKQCDELRDDFNNVNVLFFYNDDDSNTIDSFSSIYIFYMKTKHNFVLTHFLNMKVYSHHFSFTQSSLSSVLVIHLQSTRNRLSIVRIFICRVWMTSYSLCHHSHASNDWNIPNIFTLCMYLLLL